MTHACCPDCGLRVVSASPAGAPSCPGCGQPMVSAAAAESIGFRLVTAQPLPLPAAVAAALTIPVQPDPRS